MERDEIGGAAVNVVPSAKPSDIYQLVADKAIEALERLARQNTPVAENAHETAPTDAELVADKAKEQLIEMAARKQHDAETSHDEEGASDAELAQWWLELEFGITRKVTKRPT